jgi:hypothetical protein
MSTSTYFYVMFPIYFSCSFILIEGNLVHSVPITADVVGSNIDKGEMYNIMW